MIRGETVTVITRGVIGRDPLNNPIYGDTETSVEDVLVAPGPRTDVIESNRPDGVEVQWTLHLPKTFVGSLRGASIKVRGGDPLAVIGDPQPFTDANTPGRCNRPVEVQRADG